MEIQISSKINAKKNIPSAPQHVLRGAGTRAGFDLEVRGDSGAVCGGGAHHQHQHNAHGRAGAAAGREQLGQQSTVTGCWWRERPLVASTFFSRVLESLFFQLGALCVG